MSKSLSPPPAVADEGEATPEGDVKAHLQLRQTMWPVCLLPGCALISYGCLVLLLRLVPGPPGKVDSEVAVCSFEYGMTAFATSFMLYASSILCRRDKEKQIIAMLTCYICVIAFATNFLLHNGIAPATIDFFGRQFHRIRYIQWMHTTPFMIHMAGQVSTLKGHQVRGVQAADILMLLTGLASSLSSSWFMMLLMLFLSFVFFYVTIVSIWCMFRAALQEVRDIGSYNSLRFLQVFTMFVWHLFPIVWVAGACNFIDEGSEAVLYLIGDVCAKVIFSGLLLEGSFLTIEQRRRLAQKMVEDSRKETLIEELKEAVTEKERFLASMSHELRTPLNGIIGLSETILDGACGPVDECLKKSILTIKHSGGRLKSLVNDILDVASLKRNKLVLRREKVKVRQIVEHVLDLTGPLVKWSVKLNNEVPANLATIEADTSRLIQVLHNLVGNAAKFTDEGHITVSAELRHDTTGIQQVAVSVRDTGIGIPKEKQKVIFQAFEQVDMSVTRRYGGTGLGLSLVESLVHAHHGHMEVKSELGKGSVFTFVIPVQQPEIVEEQDAQKAASRKPEVPGESTPPRDSGGTPNTPKGRSKSVSRRMGRRDGTSSAAIREAVSQAALTKQVDDGSQSSGIVDSTGRLLRSNIDVSGVYEIMSVDDDPVNQMVVEGMLKPAGYKVTKKMDGLEAMQYLQRRNILPDLILLDVMMPGMSGHEVCQQVREMLPASAIPIIMVSAKSQEVDIVEGFKAGANDYVTKPFKRLEIIARIETQLKLKKLWNVEMEAAKSNQLLRKMLPESIIKRLSHGHSLIADAHQEVSILFSDIVGFTEVAASSSTADLIFMLNGMFTNFDELVDMHGVYKVETIGDAYMVVAGHDGAEDHAARIINMARDMLERVKTVRRPDGKPVEIRIGVHSGAAYAGVIGTKCPRYCFFGDTVNTASRMESNGFPMSVHCSAATWAKLHNTFDFVSLGTRQIKGKGAMDTYLLKIGEWEEALQALKASGKSDGEPMSPTAASAPPGGPTLVRSTSLSEPMRRMHGLDQPLRSKSGEVTCHVSAPSSVPPAVILKARSFTGATNRPPQPGPSHLGLKIADVSTPRDGGDSPPIISPQRASSAQEGGDRDLNFDIPAQAAELVPALEKAGFFKVGRSAWLRRNRHRDSSTDVTPAPISRTNSIPGNPILEEIPKVTSARWNKPPRVEVPDEEGGERAPGLVAAVKAMGQGGGLGKAAMDRLRRASEEEKSLEREITWLAREKATLEEELAKAADDREEFEDKLRHLEGQVEKLTDELERVRSEAANALARCTVELDKSQRRLAAEAAELSGLWMTLEPTLRSPSSATPSSKHPSFTAWGTPPGGEPLEVPGRDSPLQKQRARAGRSQLAESVEVPGRYGRLQRGRAEQGEPRLSDESLPDQGPQQTFEHPLPRGKKGGSSQGASPSHTPTYVGATHNPFLTKSPRFPQENTSRGYDSDSGLSPNQREGSFRVKSCANPRVNDSSPRLGTGVREASLRSTISSRDTNSPRPSRGSPRSTNASPRSTIGFREISPRSTIGIREASLGSRDASPKSTLDSRQATPRSTRGSNSKDASVYPEERLQEQARDSQGGESREIQFRRRKGCRVSFVGGPNGPQVRWVDGLEAQAGAEMRAFLSHLELDHYIPMLEEEEATLDLLASLDDEGLKKLGITTLGARMRLLQAFQGLKSEPLGME